MGNMKKITDEELENVSGGAILQKGPSEFYIIDDKTGEILAGPFSSFSQAVEFNDFIFKQSNAVITTTTTNNNSENGAIPFKK